MDTRGTESPMEFEWQSHGPVDPSSPFLKHNMDKQKKRPFSTFESPLKTMPQSLREPSSQPYYFSAAPRAPENSQYRAPSFTTPRKPLDVDFSSPADDSSPAEQADNEDTPDGKTIPIDFGKDAKASNKRNSLFGLYGKFAPSRSAKSKKGYADGIAKKMHKKRRRAQNFEQQLVLGRRSSEESSDEDVSSRPKSKAPQPPQEVGWMTGLFTFIHTYPDAPSIIAKYLQVFFNAAILAGCLYMFYSFYATIQSDVNRASEEAMAEVLSEMAACSKNYVDNRCGADNRLPALETVCSNWELCMNRDPSAVKRARLSAHTFAEIFNSFVEPISLKTMLFSLMVVAVGLIINNMTFTLFRRSQEQHYADIYRQPSNPYMQPAAAIGQFAATTGVPYGQTPQPIGWGMQDNYGHGQQHSIEYGRSPSKEFRARSRSPEKNLVM